MTCDHTVGNTVSDQVHRASVTDLYHLVGELFAALVDQLAINTADGLDIGGNGGQIV